MTGYKLSSGFIICVCMLVCMLHHSSPALPLVRVTLAANSLSDKLAPISLICLICLTCSLLIDSQAHHSNCSFLNTQAFLNLQEMCHSTFKLCMLCSIIGSAASDKLVSARVSVDNKLFMVVLSLCLCSCSVSLCGHCMSL